MTGRLATLAVVVAALAATSPAAAKPLLGRTGGLVLRLRPPTVCPNGHPCRKAAWRRLDTPEELAATVQVERVPAKARWRPQPGVDATKLELEPVITRATIPVTPPNLAQSAYAVTSFSSGFVRERKVGEVVVGLGVVRVVDLDVRRDLVDLPEPRVPFGAMVFLQLRPAERTN